MKIVFLGIALLGVPSLWAAPKVTNEAKAQHEAERLRVLSQPAFQNNRSAEQQKDSGAVPPKFEDSEKQNLVDGTLGGVSHEAPREPASIPSAGQTTGEVPAPLPDEHTGAPALAERAPANAGQFSWGIYAFIAFFGFGLFWVFRKKR